ncbi:MAG: hypothetical protein ACLPTJ_15090 [Solirubrobacteraceae bacterium]
MSPAGAGVRQFRTHTNKPVIGAVLAVAALVGCMLLIPAGSQARAHTAPPVAALSPAWAEFQSDCVSGPAPGQGSTPQACVCWEGNLQAEVVVPGYAVDALNAAQLGGGPAFTVLQNIGNVAISNAAQGCGLYQQ